MLELYRKGNNEMYFFSMVRNITDEYSKKTTVHYGIVYDVGKKSFSLLNGYLLGEIDNISKIDFYELMFNEKNILETIKKKIQRRIKHLNKKQKGVLNQVDFLSIALKQEIERFEQELKKMEE